MPQLTSLKIQTFRNLANITLDSLAPINVFCGDNGSGKTSLLEAIYFLGTGRSFRCSQANTLIQHSMDCFRVIASIDAGSYIVPVGVEKPEKGSKQIHVDGKKTRQQADLAKWLPIQLISTLSYRFFTDGPRVRRQFFDWAVFHVEPTFYQSWKEWQKLLKQRNACLKQRRPKAEIDAWNDDLCDFADLIDQFRRQMVKDLTPLMQSQLEALGAPFQLTLDYQRGWPDGKNLEAILAEQIEQDYQLGYTQSGPQRADLQLLVDGRPAVHVLSQGQQKLAMYAMHLTLGRHLQQQTGQTPIYLIDDMASELDPGVQQRVLSHITQQLQAQLFLTSITANLIAQLPPERTHAYSIQSGQIALMAPCST